MTPWDGRRPGRGPARRGAAQAWQPGGGGRGEARWCGRVVPILGRAARRRRPVLGYCNNKQGVTTSNRDHEQWNRGRAGLRSGAPAGRRRGQVTGPGGSGARGGWMRSGMGGWGRPSGNSWGPPDAAGQGGASPSQVVARCTRDGHVRGPVAREGPCPGSGRRREALSAGSRGIARDGALRGRRGGVEIGTRDLYGPAAVVLRRPCAAARPRGRREGCKNAARTERWVVPRGARATHRPPGVCLGWRAIRRRGASALLGSPGRSCGPDERLLESLKLSSVLGPLASWFELQHGLSHRSAAALIRVRPLNGAHKFGSAHRFRPC